MLLIRAFEETVARLRAEGHVPGFVHLAHGQEAVCAGLSMGRQTGDCLTSSHRCHGHAIAWGLQPAPLLAEILGLASGYNGGRAGSQHVAAPALGFLGGNGIVGAGVPLALGAALTARRRATGTISVAVFGDGAANQGAVLEAMNLAARHHLPILMLLENNGWGQATPTRQATAAPALASRAEAFGLLARQLVDSSYPAVTKGVAEAMAEVRTKSVPLFLEVQTRRLAGHHSQDDRGREPLLGPDDPVRQLADQHNLPAEALMAPFRADMADMARTLLAEAATGDRP